MEMDRSVELLTFHEAISNLLESEDLVVEEHRALVQVRGGREGGWAWEGEWTWEEE